MDLLQPCVGKNADHERSSRIIKELWSSLPAACHTSGASEVAAALYRVTRAKLLSRSVASSGFCQRAPKSGCNLSGQIYIQFMFIPPVFTFHYLTFQHLLCLLKINFIIFYLSYLIWPLQNSSLTWKSFNETCWMTKQLYFEEVQSNKLRSLFVTSSKARTSNHFWTNYRGDSW